LLLLYTPNNSSFGLLQQQQLTSTINGDGKIMQICAYIAFRLMLPPFALALRFNYRVFKANREDETRLQASQQASRRRRQLCTFYCVVY